VEIIQLTNNAKYRELLFAFVEEMVKALGTKRAMVLLYEAKNKIKEGDHEQETKPGTKRR